MVPASHSTLLCEPPYRALCCHLVVSTCRLESKQHKFLCAACWWHVSLAYPLPRLVCKHVTSSAFEQIGLHSCIDSAAQENLSL